MAADATKPSTNNNLKTTDETASDPLAAHSSPAGILVLQWLTYAFWGWLIVGIIWLMSVILVNAMLNTPVTEVVPYAIAASVVMLPIAFVCDLFYRRHEPLKKAGGAMVIMMIHAVIFALLGIGALVTTVFIGVNTAINVSSEGVDGQTVALLVAGFASLVYAATFLRVLNPFKGKKLSLIYGFGMLAITVLLLIFAVVGPVVKSVATRGDRVIEQNLPVVQGAVENYITDNGKLPASLGDVTIANKEAKKLVDDNKVEYNALSNGTTVSGQTALRYELCVTYTAASSKSSYGSDDDNGRFKSYISTYSHDAGRTCYKLQQELYRKTYNGLN